MHPSIMYMPQYLCRVSLRPWSIKTVRSWLSHEKTKLVKHSHFSSVSTSIKTPTGTHYELFPHTLASGPPPSGPFHIDKKALRREFLQLQARAHPDRHSTSKHRAEQESALINEAYKTLQSPLSRAQYLLSLRAIDVKEDESTSSTVSAELLDEVMDIREAIDEAAPNDLETLKRLKTENDQRIEQSEARLAQAFESDNWDAAKVETIRLKYWTSVKSSIDEFETLS